MDELKLELKKLIIEECDKDISPDDIADEAQLVGGDLDIDSLDVLQICMAIKTRYGVRIEGSNQARKVLKNILTLSDYVATHRN